MSRRAQENAESKIAVARPEIQEPRQYEVILHDDDYTTMDFVVEILRRFFNKTLTEAEQIMLAVHEKGSAIVGIYPREIAEMRVEQVTSYAQMNEFPLMATLRPH